MKTLTMFLCLAGAATVVPAQAAEESEGLFGAGLPIYIGLGYSDMTVSVSDHETLVDQDYDSRLYRARLGVKLHDRIGVEVQYGFGDEDEAPDFLETDQYYGAFLVPSGKVLDLFEWSFPIGYSSLSVKQGVTDIELEGVAYGLNIEFPLEVLSEALPDFRIVGGGMVYQQDSETRSYGWHAGLRYDFKL